MGRVLSGVLAVLVGCLWATAAEAQGHGRDGNGEVRFRVGLFEPAGESEFWDGQFESFTGSIDDLEDTSFAIEYLWHLGRSSSLAFGWGYYDGETTQAYRDWETSDGHEIRHRLGLDLSEITVAWIFRFGDPGGRVIPYAGIGAGFVEYQLREGGDWIDFGDEELPVIRAQYWAEGTTTSLFAVAGLSFELSPGWSFLAEGRWREADDELGDDYGGFGEIDLGGRELSAGFAYRF